MFFAAPVVLVCSMLTVVLCQITNGGLKKRLVPSLDGSLYQVDSSGIEAVPITADFLLSSSFKFSEDLTAVGGKEVETYGIDLTTGKVCRTDHQKNFTWIACVPYSCLIQLLLYEVGNTTRFLFLIRLMLVVVKHHCV